MRNAPPARNQSFARLGELIREIDIAMLVTVTGDGALRSRPMATQQIDPGEGTIWFFTSSDSPKSDEILHKQQVNLAYASAEKQSYISVAGRAHLVRDSAKTRELWKPAAKIWFPQGVDDPNLALLRVDVTAAEYWDSPSNKMVQLYGLAKSLITGETGKAPGENAKLKIPTRDLQS